MGTGGRRSNKREYSGRVKSSSIVFVIGLFIFVAFAIYDILNEADDKTGFFFHDPVTVAAGMALFLAVLFLYGWSRLEYRFAKALRYENIVLDQLDERFDSETNAQFGNLLKKGQALDERIASMLRHHYWLNDWDNPHFLAETNNCRGAVFVLKACMHDYDKGTLFKYISHLLHRGLSGTAQDFRHLAQFCALYFEDETLAQIVIKQGVEQRGLEGAQLLPDRILHRIRTRNLVDAKKYVRHLRKVLPKSRKLVFVLKLLRLRSEWPLPWYAQGDAYFALAAIAAVDGKVGESQLQINRALKSLQSQVFRDHASIRKAEVHYLLGEYEEALRCLDNIPLPDFSSPLLSDVIYLYEALGREKHASVLRQNWYRTYNRFLRKKNLANTRPKIDEAHSHSDSTEPEEGGLLLSSTNSISDDDKCTESYQKAEFARLEVLSKEGITYWKGKELRSFAESTVFLLDQKRLLSMERKSVLMRFLRRVVAAARLDKDVETPRYLVEETSRRATECPLAWMNVMLYVAPGIGRTNSGSIQEWSDIAFTIYGRVETDARSLELYTSLLDTLIEEGRFSTSAGLGRLASLRGELAKMRGGRISKNSADSEDGDSSKDARGVREELAEMDREFVKALWESWGKEALIGDYESDTQLFDLLRVIDLRSKDVAKSELRNMRLFIDHKCPEGHPLIDELVSKVPIKNMNVTQRSAFSETLYQLPREILISPYMPPWESISVEQKEVLCDKISPVDGKYEIELKGVIISTQRPTWLHEVELIRIYDESWVESLVVYYFQKDDELFRLNGTSPPIHEVNSKFGISLSTENCLDYLRFFCFFVRAEDGPFYLLESGEDLLVQALEDEESRAMIQDHAAPAKIIGIDDKGAFICSAIVFYGNSIFKSLFSVQPSGQIEMIDDEQIGDDLEDQIRYPIA